MTEALFMVSGFSFRQEFNFYGSFVRQTELLKIRFQRGLCYFINNPLRKETNTDMTFLNNPSPVTIDIKRTISP